MHCFRIKLTCKPDPSVVSFLLGLALMKTTVLQPMRSLSYLRLDTLHLFTGVTVIKVPVLHIANVRRYNSTTKSYRVSMSTDVHGIHTDS